ncbi:MAG: GNAT family N-acetyltransferase [Lacisediminihabitans sp.]
MVTFLEAAVTDDAAVTLLTEYFSSRAQSFPANLGEYRTTFPIAEQFVPPVGVFLLVETDDPAGEPADVGCGGIRRVAPAPGGATRYEIKHLWLQPQLRGLGYGRALLGELESRARGFGAAEIVLDTNRSQTAAGRLYAAAGYLEIAPYNDNPNATAWYAKTL